MAKRGEIFNTVEYSRPQSNIFDLSHDKKLTMAFGQLVPILNQEVIPGDEFKIKASAMVRMAPMIAPVMHRANVYVHFFFVPNRIIYKDWEEFITGGEDGLAEPTWPHIAWIPNTQLHGTLGDYLGLPVQADLIDGTNKEFHVSSLPFCAYQKIYNEYYRDQNLTQPVFDQAASGYGDPSFTAIYNTLRSRAWQHDYFTSALPWTQKGAEAMLPSGGQAPVVAKNSADNNGQENIQWIKYVSTQSGVDDADLNTAAQQLEGGTQNLAAYIDLNDSHYADLSQATAVSINDLRKAIKLQEWLEKNARGGSRYTESIMVHFGVRSSDARLQRPEFLGGSASPMKISEVLQTSETTETGTPQANMSGHGISLGGGKTIRYKAEEHGYIMGIMSIMPTSAYHQGIPKGFQRKDKFDYPWPEFANLGEQPVMNSEIVLTDDDTYNEGIFGYLPRYSEYKYASDTVHGNMKTNLDFWHMSRKFSTPVQLNEDFIRMDAQEVDRIFAVQDAGATDALWCQVYNTVKVNRKLPRFGTPKLI